MKIQRLPDDEAFAALRSSARGLSSAEAARRLSEYGPNRVERAGQTPWLRHVTRDFFHFFALLLWAAAALAFFADHEQPGAGMARLGWAIVAVVLVNGAFSFLQEYRAERAILALEKLLPHEVMALREGQPARVPAESLVPGDVILLELGDEVPADARLVEAAMLRVNDAAITGESVPRSRDAAPSDQEELAHAGNVVLAGTSVVTGRARAVVFATGMRTELGRIAHLTQATLEPASPLQREILHLSRVVALLSLALGGSFFALGRVAGFPFWDSFLFGIGILVANVPEGLLPTVTLSLAMAAQRMARRNALVRHLPAVEALGSATVICTDKTGTLTENRMHVRQLWLSGRDVPRDALDAAAAEAHRPLLEAALLCQDTKLTRVEGGLARVGDPTESALVELAEQAPLALEEAPRLDELPFDPARRRLTTLNAHGASATVYCKGALEALLPLCDRVLVDGATVALDAPGRAEASAAEARLAASGLRVLAFAFAPARDRQLREESLILSGLVALEDPPRPEVPRAVRRCRDAGIRVIMLTGDHPRTAAAIARRVGIVESQEPLVIVGDRLRRMSEVELQLALDAPEVLFARLAPDQKLRIVTALQRKREVVAVTGDGVNDAPALRAADIGIAMGRDGTEVARQAADIVLADDHFATIVNAIEEGRAVFSNIRKFMTYILTSNVPEIVPYLLFSLARAPLALPVLQILAVDLGTDLVPALALGAEPPSKTVMAQPPRRRDERLVRPPLLARAYLFLGLLEAAGSMAVFFFMLAAGGWRWGDPVEASLYRTATASCLATIVVMQIANLVACRSSRASAFSARPRNPLLLVGVGVEVVLLAAILFTPWGQTAFGTAAVPAAAWLLAGASALALLALEEARKALGRSRGMRAPRPTPHH